MTSGELNLAWARVIIAALADLGVEEVEVAPGSRSAPLVLALRSFPGIRARVHLDERCAAFFALGYGRRTRRPAAVLTTSGTAVANLLPAVVEADASDIPLVLLTADRPPRLRGADANQTIDQAGIFGDRVRVALDLPVPSQDGCAELGLAVHQGAASAWGPPGGPVHLNVPFDKPLQPESADAWRLQEAARARRHEAAAKTPRPAEPRPAGLSPPFARASLASADAELITRCLADAGRPLVVAGPSADPDADGAVLARFGSCQGAPVLADPLSGARFARVPGTGVVGAYDHFLRVADLRKRLAPDLVIRTGRTPTSSVLERALASWSGACQIVIDAGGHRKDHQRLADHYVRAPPDILAGLPAPGTTTPSCWLRAWAAAETATWAVIAGADGFADPGNEGAYAAAVLRALAPGGTLFVSSSMPVRDVDSYGQPAPNGVRVLGNRGASGIDGIVSSVLGCAAGSDGPVAGLLGDLAFYHDMNGLLAARDPALNAVFVVLDNDGGGIFHMLPICDFEPVFTPYFATPHGLDFTHSARLYGIPFRDVSAPEALEPAVAEAIRRPGCEIIRVRTDRETNRGCHERIRERVAEHFQEEKKR